jgi:hypothetical protein
MKPAAGVLFVLLTGLVQAADTPSFTFKNELPAFNPPKVRDFELKLGDVIKKHQVPPPMTYLSPSFKSAPDRVPQETKRASKPLPAVRIIRPREDVDFKLLMKEPDPNIDPKFVVPDQDGSK